MVLKETLLRPLVRARLRGVSPLRLVLRTRPPRGTERGRGRKRMDCMLYMTRFCIETDDVRPTALGAFSKQPLPEVQLPG